MNEAHVVDAAPVMKAGQVMNAARVREGSKLDVKILFAAGALLLTLSGVFLWNEMQVPAEALLVVGTVAAAALALQRSKGVLALVGPFALLACAMGGGLWYAATKVDMLLWGVGVTLVASIAAMWRTHKDPVTAQERMQNVLHWYALTLSVISASWAFYFRFLTMGIAEHHIGRRLVLTLIWLAVGVALVVLSRIREQNVIRDAGFAFIAMAIGKALLYDTVHLSGTLRVAGLAVAGAMLLGGAWLTNRKVEEV